MLVAESAKASERSSSILASAKPLARLPTFPCSWLYVEETVKRPIIAEMPTARITMARSVSIKLMPLSAFRSPLCTFMLIFPTEALILGPAQGERAERP